MCDSKAYIRDHQSLIELNNTLEYSADSMLKILEQVDQYLTGVMACLNDQLQALEEQLRIAEEKLAEAEDRLRVCEASQEWDEEKNEYRPSCKWETSNVNLARKIRDDYQQRVNQAKEIIHKCQHEVDEYKKPGGLVDMPGGEKTLMGLAKEHTDQATSKMRDILEVVSEYLNHSVSGKQTATTSFGCVNGSASGQATECPAKAERFRLASQRVIERQQRDSGDRLADANRAMRCAKCGRPLVGCICSKNREREYTRENIVIIKNQYSR